MAIAEKIASDQVYARDVIFVVVEVDGRGIKPNNVNR